VNDLLLILGGAGILLIEFGGRNSFYGYLMLAAAAIIVFGKAKGFGFLSKFSKEKSEGTHGSARFAARRDMQKLTTNTLEIDAGELLLAPLGKKYKIFGQEEYLFLPAEEAVKHVLLTGPSGSGKSRGFYMPNCMAFQSSMVVTDPKSELWKYTSGFHKNAARFSPRDPDASTGFNWIPFCKDANLVRLLARAVVTSSGESSGDKFWSDAETDLISGLFAHAAEFKVPTPAAMYDYFTSHNPATLAESLSESPSKIAAQLSASFINASENTRGSIIAGVSTKLSFLTDENVRRFTSASDRVINFECLRREKGAIYWCLEENDVAQLRPLSSLFFSLVMYQVKQSSGHLPVSFFLDELGNLGKLPNLEIEVSVVRGRGISLIFGIQSYSQIYAVYGERAGQIIIDNCSTKIYLSGCDYDTAERVSKALGETTITESRETEGERGGSKTPVKTQRRLFYADEIRQIERDQQIVITGNVKPILSKRFFYTDEPHTAKTSALGKTKTMKFTKEPPLNKQKKIAPPPPLPASLQRNPVKKRRIIS
jgi:type IV secretion system protein VirD4